MLHKLNLLIWFKPKVASYLKFQYVSVLGPKQNKIGFGRTLLWYKTQGGIRSPAVPPSLVARGSSISEEDRFANFFFLRTHMYLAIICLINGVPD